MIVDQFFQVLSLNGLDEKEQGGALRLVAIH